MYFAYPYKSENPLQILLYFFVWKYSNWLNQTWNPRTKLKKKEGDILDFCWTAAFAWARQKRVLDQLNICDDLFTQPQIFFFVMHLMFIM